MLGGQYGSAEAHLAKTLESDEPRQKKWIFQRRYIITILAFFGLANIYTMRANLSVAIVQMSSDTVSVIDGKETIRRAEFREWDSITQGAILGAFFYGYIFTQIPGGYFAHRYGGKFVFFFAVFGTAVFTIISPPLVKISSVCLIVARFFEGFFEGMAYPSMHAILANWAPTMEKARMSAVAYAGSYFGTVVAMPISAVLGQRFGWPSIFYFFGVAALVWCFFWVKLFYNQPEDDPKITTNELTLLKRDASHTKSFAIPWRQILTSKAVWAIITAHVCQNWGFYTMLTSLPRIIEDLLGYNRETAGSFAALPYMVMGIILLAAGGIADFLRERYSWSALKARKIFCCLGLILEALFLLVATLETFKIVVLTAIIASVGLGGLSWSAFSVNSLDIAPQYAGHLMGVSNTLATLPGMIAPLFVGAIVKNQSPSEWRFVFCINSGIYLFGALVFCIWAEGGVQKWATHDLATSTEIED